MVGQDNRGEGQSAYRVASHFHAPPPEFSALITTFYRLELETEPGAELHDHMQPEWGSMRFFCGSTPRARLNDRELSGVRFGVSGPSSNPIHFWLGSAKVWGIGLLPLGWARLVDADASEFANTLHNGETHPLFSKFAGLCDVLCNDSLSVDDQLAAICDTLAALDRPHRDEAKIIRAHRALLDEELASVADFAEQAEMSVRTLERVCLRHFGFPPKLLMRRQRFMRSLTAFMLSGGKNWSDVIDAHYHDQSHFSREFRHFMGVTPTEFAAEPHPFLDSFVEARARLWGSPALTLDKPD